MTVLESPCGNDEPTKMLEEYKSCSSIVDALIELPLFYQTVDLIARCHLTCIKSI